MNDEYKAKLPFYSSYVLQFASRRFLDTLLTGEDGTRRTNRQLQVRQWLQLQFH